MIRERRPPDSDDGDDPAPRALDATRSLLRAYEGHRHISPAAGLRRAAVMIPLVARPTGLEVILTLRPKTLNTHAGQVSFPGGSIDAADASCWETALRETHEELAIPPDSVERVAMLDDYDTVTGFHITPCVAILPADQRLVPYPDEVAEVFAVPLAELADPRRLRTMRGGGGGDDVDHRLYFYLIRPHVVWGATAAMLTQLLEVLGLAVPL